MCRSKDYSPKLTTAVRLALLAAMICALPAMALADTITLRFDGTADLTAFGGSPESAFEGTVTWDPAFDPQSYGGYYARYLLDGQPSSVTATFSIDSIDYTGRIAPWSRLEQFYDELFLDLYLVPAVDLDGGFAPDLLNTYLILWSDTQVFGNVAHLPSDLSFVSSLDHRVLGFVDTEYQALATANTLSVPEPSALALVLLGVSGASASRWKRRGTPESASA